MSLRHALLGLIDLESGSGYDLVQRIRHSIGFFWPASHQQIYRELHSLSAEGYLQSLTEIQTHRPDRHIYSLTAAGANELEQWLAQDSAPAKIRDPFLLRVFTAHRFTGEVFLQQIEKQKNIHTETLKLYEKLADKMQQWPEAKRYRYRFARHTLQLGIYFEHAWLQWCNELLELMTEKNNC